MRVNISTVSCSYNEWFRRRAEDLLFLATFESVMKKDDVGTVFCIMHLVRAGSKWHRQVVTGCKTLHESSCHLTSPSTLWWWPWSTSVAVTQLFTCSSLSPKVCGHYCVWQILDEEWIARSACNGIVTGCLLFWRRLKLYFCGKRPKLAQRLTLRKRPVTEKMKKRWKNPEVL